MAGLGVRFCLQPSCRYRTTPMRCLPFAASGRSPLTVYAHSGSSVRVEEPDRHADMLHLHVKAITQMKCLNTIYFSSLQRRQSALPGMWSSSRIGAAPMCRYAAQQHQHQDSGAHCWTEDIALWSIRSHSDMHSYRDRLSSYTQIPNRHQGSRSREINFTLIFHSSGSSVQRSHDALISSPCVTREVFGVPTLKSRWAETLDMMAVNLDVIVLLTLQPWLFLGSCRISMQQKSSLCRTGTGTTPHISYGEPVENNKASCPIDYTSRSLRVNLILNAFIHIHSSSVGCLAS